MALGMSADTNNNRCLATESLSLHVSSTPKAMLFECVNVCVCVCVHTSVIKTPLTLMDCSSASPQSLPTIYP